MGSEESAIVLELLLLPRVCNTVNLDMYGFLTFDSVRIGIIIGRLCRVPTGVKKHLNYVYYLKTLNYILESRIKREQIVFFLFLKLK